MYQQLFEGSPSGKGFIEKEVLKALFPAPGLPQGESCTFKRTGCFDNVKVSKYFQEYYFNLV